MTEEWQQQKFQTWAPSIIFIAPYPFPVELFDKIITENNGYFPITIEAIPDGSLVYPNVPIFQVSAEGQWAPLCTWLECVLMSLWYPSTVATLSRKVRTLIQKAFETSADSNSLLSSRLHDFGYRGCTCIEQAEIGGAAHLLNFTGTDNLPGAYHAQYYYNHGIPLKDGAYSIPATEHSVMTSWDDEKSAVLNLIDKYGTGIYSCVLDSYDYNKALSELLPSIKQRKLDQGGVFIIRPDSGDPVKTVLDALKAAETVFGVTMNKKGYKVLTGAAVIQGDGISLLSLSSILDAILALGFSAENVAFGMGGGLLQRVNRDTASFACKLSFIQHQDGTGRPVMKYPSSDSKKMSLPGELQVVHNKEGLPLVFSKSATPPSGCTSIMEVVYDKGPINYKFQTFDEIRDRVEREWQRGPPKWDAISSELKELSTKIRQKA